MAQVTQQVHRQSNAFLAVEESVSRLPSLISAPAVLPCEDYSSLKRLTRVTAYILKFANAARAPGAGTPSQVDCVLTTEDFHLALTYWIKVSQSSMLGTRHFDQWRSRFGLYQDDCGIWRYGGRLGNTEMPQETNHPILLNRDHHLTLRECHKRVMQCAVEVTLTEIRSKYWIVQGRRFVRGVFHKCTLCRRFQGKPYAPPPAPPLPSFRVNEARPFTYTRVDFAGRLYVRAPSSLSSR